jgi:DNA-binding response OmpR family regulator
VSVTIEDKRILVVDDDLPQLEATLEMLGSQGFRYYGTTSEDEALAFAQAEPLDALILSLNSSGRALDFLRELRNAKPRLRVLVTADYASAARSSAIRVSGASSILHRPYSAKSLSDAMHTLLTK